MEHANTRLDKCFNVGQVIVFSLLTVVLVSAICFFVKKGVDRMKTHSMGLKEICPDPQFTLGVCALLVVLFSVEHVRNRNVFSIPFIGWDEFKSTVWTGGTTGKVTYS